MTQTLSQLINTLDITSLYSPDKIDKEQVNLYLGCILDEWQDINFILSLKIEYWKIEKNFEAVFQTLDQKDLEYWLDLLDEVRPNIVRYVDQTYVSKSEIIFDYDSHNVSIEYDFSSPQEREHNELLSHIIKLESEMTQFLATNYDL